MRCAAKAAVDAANADVDAANAVIDAASTGVGVFDPLESSRDYSSKEDFYYGWSFLGFSYGSRTESALEGLGRPWKPSSAKVGEWMRIDAGSAVEVFGVRIKQGGTAKYDQKVTGVTIQHSTDERKSEWSDGDPAAGWTEVKEGKIFTGTSGSFDATFGAAVKARYIRITVQSWIGYPAMRAGLLIDNPGEPVPLGLRNQRIVAISAKQANELEFEAATMGQLAKSGTAEAAAKAAATAEEEAAVYDKLTGKMYFIGVSIDHFTYPQ